MLYLDFPHLSKLIYLITNTEKPSPSLFHALFLSTKFIIIYIYLLIWILYI